MALSVMTMLLALVAPRLEDLVAIYSSPPFFTFSLGRESPYSARKANFSQVTVCINFIEDQLANQLHRLEFHICGLFSRKAPAHKTLKYFCSDVRQALSPAMSVACSIFSQSR
jgi:hypothetical protein